MYNYSLATILRKWSIFNRHIVAQNTAEISDDLRSKIIESSVYVDGASLVDPQSKGRLLTPVLPIWHHKPASLHCYNAPCGDPTCLHTQIHHSKSTQVRVALFTTPQHCPPCYYVGAQSNSVDNSPKSSPTDHFNLKRQTEISMFNLLIQSRALGQEVGHASVCIDGVPSYWFSDNGDFHSPKTGLPTGDEQFYTFMQNDVLPMSGDSRHGLQSSGSIKRSIFESGNAALFSQRRYDQSRCHTTLVDTATGTPVKSCNLSTGGPTFVKLATYITSNVHSKSGLALFTRDIMWMVSLLQLIARLSYVKLAHEFIPRRVYICVPNEAGEMLVFDFSSFVRENPNSSLLICISMALLTAGNAAGTSTHDTSRPNPFGLLTAALSDQTIKSTSEILRGQYEKLRQRDLYTFRIGTDDVTDVKSPEDILQAELRISTTRMEHYFRLALADCYGKYTVPGVSLETDIKWTLSRCIWTLQYASNGFLDDYILPSGETVYSPDTNICSCLADKVGWSSTRETWSTGETVADHIMYDLSYVCILMADARDAVQKISYRAKSDHHSNQGSDHYNNNNYYQNFGGMAAQSSSQERESNRTWFKIFRL